MAVVAEIVPKIIPGILQNMMGQSLFVFQLAYKVQAVQLITVIIGRIIEPGCPFMFRRIWSI